MAEQLYSFDFTPALSPGDGPTSENGRVKQSELIADLDDVSYAIYSARIKGTWCTDRGSVVGNCNIWVKTKSGYQQAFAVGDTVTIYYSTTNVWTTVIANDAGNNYISFGDADADTPTVPGIGDYSAGAFIDALTIKVEPNNELLSKSHIIVVGDGALTGDDVARSAADATKLSTKMATLETQTDSVIETAGGLKADVVEATNVVKQGADSIFENDNPDNMVVDGSCEVFLGGIALGILPTLVPATSYTQETTIVKHGDSSQKFVTGALGIGLRFIIDPEVGGVTDPGVLQKIGKNLADKECTIACWVYSSVENNISVGFWDDVELYQVTQQTVAAATWTLVSATATIGTDAEEVYGVVVSATAAGPITNNYVDFAGIFLGATAFEVAPSTQSRVIHNQLDVQPYQNLIPFGDFAAENSPQPGGNDFLSAAWLLSETAAPTGWQVVGLNTIVRDVVEYKFANASCEMGLAIGGAMYTYIGLNDSYEDPLTTILGRWITFSTWLYRDGGTNTEDLTLEIRQDVGAGYVSVNTADFTVDDYGAWEQVWVTGYISTSAIGVELRFINNGGAVLNVFVDGVMCHPGQTPVAFTPNSGWRQREYTALYAGSLPVAATEMFSMFGMTARFLLDTAHIIYGAAVNVQTPASGDDLFYPRKYVWNGATFVVADLRQYDITLGSAVEYGTMGSIGSVEPVYLSAGQMLGAVVDSVAIIGAGDATFTILALTWGV